MRTAGLIALAILLPASVQAENPPALSAYTISHDTIYPAAAIGSGLATTTAIDIAFSEAVKASIKVLSSSGAVVKTLYTSSSVTNPAPKIWDGANTAGAQVGAGTYTILIFATSTATSLAMTDSSKTIIVSVSDGSSAPEADTSSDAETVTTPPAASPGNGTPEYILIPTLRISTESRYTVSSGADAAFRAVVYDGKGNKRDDAVVTWSFGDGMRNTGASVFHTYYDPGEYLAIVHAITSDGGDVQKEVFVTVQDARIRISAISSRGIALTNGDSRAIDLSFWRLSADGQEFKIPEDTHILSGRTILFSPRVTGLAATGSASLLYPSGEVAATYPETAGARVETLAQPPVQVVSYKQVQKVEPITSPGTDVQSYEEAGLAPAAVPSRTAAGAAPAAVLEAPAASALKSPWTLGLLGVMVLAASAFILL